MSVAQLAVSLYQLILKGISVADPGFPYSSHSNSDQPMSNMSLQCEWKDFGFMQGDTFFICWITLPANLKNCDLPKKKKNGLRQIGEKCLSEAHFYIERG